MLTIQKKQLTNKLFKSKPKTPKETHSVIKSNNEKTKPLKETRKECPREYFLANKVLIQWKWFVTQQRRMHSSVYHHNTNAARDAFHFWKSKCKKRKSLWRDVIRAQVHHRYLLLTSAFVSWRHKYHDTLLINGKMELAKEHSDYYPLGASLIKWKKYISCRRIKQKQDKYALLFYCQSKFKKYIVIWKRALSTLIDRQCLIRSAQSFHRLYICAKSFEKWTHECNKRSTYKQELNHADQWSFIRVLDKYFMKWNVKYQDQEQRNCILENAQVHYNRHLVSRLVRIWKVKSIQSLMEFNQLELAEWIYKKNLLKCIITTWAKQTEISLYDQIVVENVRNARNVKIKKIFVSQLLQLVLLWKQSSVYSMQTKYRNLFEKWKFKANYKSFLREQETLVRGILYYQSHIKNKVLYAWKSYVLEARIQNEKELKAIHFKRFHFRKWAILKWKRKHEQLEWNLSASCQANEHYTFTLCKRIWCMWENALVSKWKESICIKKADRHYKSSLMMNGLKALYNHVIENQKYRHQMEVASVHFNITFVKKVILGWFQLTRSGMIKQDQKRIAIRFSYFSHLYKGWRVWQKRVVGKRQGHMRWNLAMASYDYGLISKQFVAWKEYIQAKKYVFNAVLNMEKGQISRLKLQIFTIWRDRCTMECQRRSDFFYILTKVNCDLMRQCWAIWKHVYDIKMQEYTSKLELANAMQRQLNSYKSSRIVQEWFLYTQCRLEKRQFNHESILFLQKLSIKRIVLFWNKKTRHVKWKKIMNQKAFELYSHSLESKYFAIWKIPKDPSCTWKDLYHKRHTIPYSHWKSRMISSHLKAWRVVVEDKKEYELATSQAYKARKQGLLTNGLAAWIKRGQELEENKLEILASSQMINLRQVQLAYKYAWKWKTFIINRRYSNRQSLVKEQVSQRMLRTYTNSGSKPKQEVKGELFVKRPEPRKPEFLLDETSLEFKKSNFTVPSIHRHLINTTSKQGNILYELDKKKSPDLSNAIQQKKEKCLSLLTLEKILKQSTCGRPESMDAVAYPILDKESFNTENIQEIENKLLHFQKLKQEYQENKTQIGLLQVAMNELLSKRDSSCSLQLEQIIKKCEELRMEMKGYEESWPVIKQETLSLSRQIQVLLMTNPSH